VLIVSSEGLHEKVLPGSGCCGAKTCVFDFSSQRRHHGGLKPRILFLPHLPPSGSTSHRPDGTSNVATYVSDDFPFLVILANCP
jgi:hypothetical protein